MQKKSYTAGRLTKETEKSASSDEVMEVGMKSSTKNVKSSPSQVAEKSCLPSVVVHIFWKFSTSGD